MLKEPMKKYKPAAAVNLPDRTWVNKTITQAPIWLSTDLRDGNQSLFDPMNVATKLAFFDELVRIGFKEIEIGFPSASDIDYKFTRKLIEESRIPDDVTPMVITQAREDLIRKTVESLAGAKRAIVHVYNATAPAWRDMVFNMTVDQVIDLVSRQVAYLKSLTDQHPETEWSLQYSPETFSATELNVALRACNAAIEAWDASSARKIIINLPSTVENSTPNVFADRIEWMDRHLSRRESVIISVHPHNDRGTGIATAELSLLAGAQRIEGCLFGNGERSGNVDIVTLALNLYTQGVHPGLNFSNIAMISKRVEEFTRIPVHPRHPYAGDLVFTAFSGSHQDAIKKGFSFQKDREVWAVPYLPIDPKDLGRSYESIIRINSQSGKGGIAYLLEKDYGIVLPRKMQVEFSGEVQRITDGSGSEISSAELYRLFEKTYLDKPAAEDVVRKGLSLINQGEKPVAAMIKVLGLPVEIVSYEERLVAGNRTIAIVEISSSGHSKFGVGLHTNAASAAINAVISAVNRLNLTPP
jgi:2-isopropylmalate synthase